MLLKLNTERYIVSKDRAQNTGFFCGKSPLNFQINTTSTRQNQQQQNKQTKRESRSMLKKCRHSCRRCCRCCCCFHAVAVVVIFMLLFPCCCFHVVVVFMLLLFSCCCCCCCCCFCFYAYMPFIATPLPPSIPTLRPMLPRSLEDKGILQDEVPEILVEIPNADGEYPRRLNLKSNGVIIKVTGAGSPECNGTYVPCEPFKDVSSTNPAWRRETDIDTSVISPLSMFALHTNPNID